MGETYRRAKELGRARLSGDNPRKAAKYPIRDTANQTTKCRICGDRIRFDIETLTGRFLVLDWRTGGRHRHQEGA